MSEVKNKITVLWSSGDKEVFTKLVFPYCFNSMANNWWDEVSLIVWGPSEKLAAEDDEVQKNISQLVDSNIYVCACKWCSDQYNASEKLIGIGIDVKFMGEPLTEVLRSGEKVLTF